MSPAGGRAWSPTVSGDRFGDGCRRSEGLSIDSNRRVAGNNFHEGGAPR